MLTDLDYQMCMRCGKCRTICPLSSREIGFDDATPRGRAMLALGIKRGELKITDEIVRVFSQCPTCRQCEANCAAGTKITQMIKETRAAIAAAGAPIPLGHKGAFHFVSRMTAIDALTANWRDMIDGDFQETGDIVYFPGCLPYLEPLLEFEIGSKNIVNGIVKIFNQAGIKPAIPPKLACCGHDAMWSGDMELFNTLKEKNSKILKDAKLIVAGCAEGYMTLKNEYSLGANIQHITQFVRDQLKNGKLNLVKGEERVTFHDPCRLGRYMGEYEAPREVLAAIANYKDMPRNRKDGVCCGVGAWVNCNECSKQVRIDRVQEAAQVADIMITACPKCLTHFNCLMQEPQPLEGLPKIKIMDFSDFVSRHLKGA
jgi:heterodisulfide reductase subunit D